MWTGGISMLCCTNSARSSMFIISFNICVDFNVNENMSSSRDTNDDIYKICFNNIDYVSIIVTL
jgi:hypothetical protein